MLVLSREEGQQIVIGEYVVTVVRIANNKVRLGVLAPRDVPVYRKEIHDRIQAERAKRPPAIGSEPGSELGSETASHDAGAA